MVLEACVTYDVVSSWSADHENIVHVLTTEDMSHAIEKCSWGGYGSRIMIEGSLHGHRMNRWYKDEHLFRLNAHLLTWRDKVDRLVREADIVMTSFLQDDERNAVVETFRQMMKLESIRVRMDDICESSE